MKVIIVGVTGGVGLRVARRLTAQGHQVTGMVRRAEQASNLEREGIAAVIADVATDMVATLADLVRGQDVVLFTAGAGGRDGPEATVAVDGDGPSRVAAAMKVAKVSRLYLVSVFPEAWRERRMDEDFEQYMVEKRRRKPRSPLLISTGSFSDLLPLSMNPASAW